MNYYFEFKSFFLAFCYTFRPIKPLSGEAVTNIYVGGTNI